MGKLTNKNLGFIVSFYWFFIFHSFQDKLQSEESSKETILTLTQHLNSHAPDWKQEDILSLCIEDFNRFVDHINANKNIMDLMTAFQIRDNVEKDIQENIILNLMKLSSDHPSDNVLPFIKKTADLWDIDLQTLIGTKETTKKISIAVGITSLEADEGTNNDKPSQGETKEIDARDDEGKTALMRAAMEGNEVLSRNLLDRGAEIEAKDVKGWTALMYAAAHGHEEIVNLLVEKNADTGAQNEDGINAYMLACANGQVGAAGALCLHTDQKAVDHCGRTALMHAAAMGQNELIETWFPESDADEIVHMDRDQSGWTALIHAAANGHMGTAIFFLKMGANIYAQALDGSNIADIAIAGGHAVLANELNDRMVKQVLIKAVKKNDIDAVEKLIKKGVDINAQDDNGMTALMHAAKAGNNESMTLLLENSADIGVINENGNNALIWAVVQGHENLVSTLLRKGSDSNSQDNSGMTALIHASQQGHTSIMKLLITQGADIEARTYDGWTALIWAAAWDRTEAISLLLDHGADIEGRNEDGCTALMRAAENGNIESVKLLISKGADVHAKSKDDKTSLDLAIENPHIRIEEKKAIADLLKPMMTAQKLKEKDAKDQGISDVYGSHDVTKDIDAVDKDGYTALMRAAMEGQTETVKLLIDKGAKIDAKDNSRWTALIWAASKGQTETAELLIDKGVDTEAKDNVQTALMWAAHFGRTETTKLLIDKGTDIEAKDNYGQTALMSAAAQGQTETAKLLIDLGVGIEAKDYTGGTALIGAAALGKTETVELLIDKGADIHVKDDYGMTALMGAAKNAFTETAELLIDKGADIHAKDDTQGCNALMFASHFGCTEIAELLIGKGADIHAKDHNGATALMRATGKGHTETAKMLIEKGANIEAKDNGGMTALMRSVSSGHTETAELLIDKGVDIEAKDDAGSTALIWAANKGQKEAAELLIDKGAEIDAKDNDGWTALMRVAYLSHAETVELFLKKGADPFIKDNDGKTALSMLMELEELNDDEEVEEKGGEKRDRIIELLKSSIAEREDECDDEKDESTEKQHATESDEVIKESNAKDDIVPGKSIQPDAKEPIPVPRYATPKTQNKDMGKTALLKSVISADEVIKPDEMWSLKDESGSHITYNSWDEFEKGQSEENPLKKKGMPVAKMVHDFLIKTLEENKLSYEIKYHGGTFSIAVPKEKAKSKKKTCARFGLLSVSGANPYLESLYKDAVDPLPEGAIYFKKRNPTQYVYRFKSIEDVKKIQSSLCKGFLISYKFLTTAQEIPCTENETGKKKTQVSSQDVVIEEKLVVKEPPNKKSYDLFITQLSHTFKRAYLSVL